MECAGDWASKAGDGPGMGWCARSNRSFSSLACTRFPASAHLPCCMHAPAAIFRAPRPSKPLPASTRRIPARACDSSPRQRSSPLPCLNLPSAALLPRVSPPQPACHAACTHPPPFSALPGPASRCPRRPAALQRALAIHRPALRSSPLPCLHLLAAAAAARMPRQNHDLVRHAHPQPHFLPAFSLLLALPVAIDSSLLCAALHTAPWVTLL